MSKKKKDLSMIGNILSDGKGSHKPSSLTEFMGQGDKDGLAKKSDEKRENNKDSVPKLASQREKVRESLSLFKEDTDLIEQMIIKSSMSGQKATKTDVYRASIKYLANLTPDALANKIKDIRKNKKTHN
jgi:hypothetical protein